MVSQFVINAPSLGLAHFLEFFGPRGGPLRLNSGSWKIRFHRVLGRFCCRPQLVGCQTAPSPGLNHTATTSCENWFRVPRHMSELAVIDLNCETIYSGLGLQWPSNRGRFHELYGVIGFFRMFDTKPSIWGHWGTSKYLFQCIYQTTSFSCRAEVRGTSPPKEFKFFFVLQRDFEKLWTPSSWRDKKSIHLHIRMGQLDGLPLKTVILCGSLAP